MAVAVSKKERSGYVLQLHYEQMLKDTTSDILNGTQTQLQNTVVILVGHRELLLPTVKRLDHVTSRYLGGEIDPEVDRKN